MKSMKIIGVLLVVAALVGSALAFEDAFSIRAKDGVVNYIGSDTQFSYVNAQLSANGVKDTPNSQERASLVIQAVTTDKRNVRVAVGIDGIKDIYQWDAHRIYLNSAARVIYANNGAPQVLNCDTVRIDYNRDTGKVNVAGECPGLAFRVTGMNVWFH